MTDWTAPARDLRPGDHYRSMGPGWRARTVLAVAQTLDTRDVSFAVAASIGAVVAAPFVAGVVAGAGATGTLATGLTVVGTGAVVGTGTGVVRGGSAALGVGEASLLFGG